MDSAGLSNSGVVPGQHVARGVALAELITSLESVLKTMDELGLGNAALHVSLGLELARTQCAEPPC